jgi:hypothetical protein
MIVAVAGGGSELGEERGLCRNGHVLRSMQLGGQDVDGACQSHHGQESKVQDASNWSH